MKLFRNVGKKHIADLLLEDLLAEIAEEGDGALSVLQDIRNSEEGDFGRPVLIVDKGCLAGRREEDIFLVDRDLKPRAWMSFSERKEGLKRLIISFV